MTAVIIYSYIPPSQLMEKPSAPKTRVKTVHAKTAPAKTVPAKPRAKKETVIPESATKEAPSATPTVPSAPNRAPRVAVQTPIDITIAKYIAEDWKIIKPPKGGLNDFIASRGSRIHFVQVVTKTTIEDLKYHGEAKNNFVQNAFSNSATPIFAHVVEGSKPKVTFEDVNTGNRALISSRKKAEDEK